MQFSSLVALATSAIFGTSAMAATISNVIESHPFKGSPSTPGTFVAHAGPEDVVAFDVDGFFSMDLYTDPDNDRATFDIAAALGLPSGTSVTVTGIGWDVSLFADSPSFLSEMDLTMTVIPDALVGLRITPAGSDDFSGSDTYSSSGMLDLTDNLLLDQVYPTGVMHLQFSESFDDFEDDWDGFWDAGQVYFEAEATLVPEPTTLALLAAGSLLALRRKK